MPNLINTVKPEPSQEKDRSGCTFGSTGEIAEVKL